MDVLPPLTAFSVFLVIAGIGFVFLVVSLVFGEVLHHFDTSLDHDLDHGGPGVFSTQTICAFVTAFGSIGAIATYYDVRPLPASMLGIAAGLVFAGGVFAFARFLYGQQASSEVLARDLVGQTARVVVAIPAGGLGQVRCRMGEELVDKIARTSNGDPIPENASVRIEEVLGETVIVTKP